MLVISHIIVLLLCAMMFVVPLKHKLAILAIVVICGDAVQLNYIPFGGSHYLVSNVFLLSEIKNIEKHVRSLNRSTIGTCIIILFIGAFFALINSPHYHSPSEWVRFFIREFTGKYLALCYGFIALKKEGDIKCVLKASYWSTLFLTFWGMVHFITKTSVWVNSVFSATAGRAEDVLNDASATVTTGRLRVQAMFHSSFDYGFACIILLFFFLWAYRSKLIDKTRFLIVTACCLFGVAACGSRTSIVVLIFAYVAYFITAYKGGKKVAWFFSLVMAVYVIMQFLPKDYLALFTEAFSTSDNFVGARGSSIGMRIVQYTAVLTYLPGHEIFGRGVDFFYYDLGWGDYSAKDIATDLHGLEGIHLGLLLERGYFGLAIWVIFIVLLVLLFKRNLKSCRIPNSIAIAMITAYVVFSMSTGELGSAYITMLYIGILIKISKLHVTPTIQISNGKNKIQHSHSSLQVEVPEQSAR